MDESAQAHPAGSPSFGYVAPMVTALATIEERDAIHGRQDRGTCGFFRWPQETGQFPDCMSAFKTFGNQEITAFECANRSGQVAIYESTDISTSQSDEETSTTADPNTEPSNSVKGDGSTNADPTTTESAPSSQTSLSDSENTSPVGPIVGGVIGGLALIALIGFGLWFIRRKKHNYNRDARGYSPGNYHSPSQSLPGYGYINHTSPDPQYNPLPMSSTPRDVSQNFSNLPYMATPQSSELPSTPGRPKNT
ncbi:hypothetical protein HYE68_005967 [Fusarium pseudograminearum]|nr:hypothetical protein HYE68_005967 [Fusarium pseudograminearum]